VEKNHMERDQNPKAHYLQGECGSITSRRSALKIDVAINLEIIEELLNLEFDESIKKGLRANYKLILSWG